jgi:hypothetical protein
MWDSTEGITKMKKLPHSVHQTQWAAQFAVASELCKRGYQVALTMGNHPIVDLMVISPKGVNFMIDVKGLYKPNFWLVSEKKTREKLFYVLALVANNRENRFFVITQQQANRAIRANLRQAMSRRRAKGLPPRKLSDFRFPGIDHSFAKGYESRWSALPQ